MNALSGLRNDFGCPVVLRCASRAAIVPGLRSVFSGQYRVYSITIVTPYLSVLRNKDRQLQVVPSLLVPSLPAVIIERITLQDGVVELFDATVARPPLKIRLEQIQATARDIVVPALTGRSRIDLAGVVKGVQRDGRASVAGWAEIATRDSSVKTQLRSVDLVALQAYLIKVDETGVRKGTLDLDLVAAGDAIALARELARKGYAGNYLGLDFSNGLLAVARQGLPKNFSCASDPSCTWRPGRT